MTSHFDVVTYSLGKYIRSNVCLDILSYMHDIGIPTKYLGSGYQELQLWFFCTHWPLDDLRWYSVTSTSKSGFFMFPTTYWKSACTSGIISGNPRWKSEKYSEYNTQMGYIKYNSIFQKFLALHIRIPSLFQTVPWYYLVADPAACPDQLGCI